MLCPLDLGFLTPTLLPGYTLLLVQHPELPPLLSRYLRSLPIPCPVACLHTTLALRVLADGPCTSGIADKSSDADPIRLPHLRRDLTFFLQCFILKNFKPTEKLYRWYREQACTLHPDLPPHLLQYLLYLFSKSVYFYLLNHLRVNCR